MPYYVHTRDELVKEGLISIDDLLNDNEKSPELKPGGANTKMKRKNNSVNIKGIGNGTARLLRGGTGRTNSG